MIFLPEPPSAHIMSQLKSEWNRVLRVAVRISPFANRRQRCALEPRSLRDYTQTDELVFAAASWRIQTHAARLRRTDAGDCLQYVSGAGPDRGARSGHRSVLAWTASRTARHGQAVSRDAAAWGVSTHRRLFERTQRARLAIDRAGVGRLGACGRADDAPGNRRSADGL